MSFVSGSLRSETNSQVYTEKVAQWLYCWAFKRRTHRSQLIELLIVKSKLECSAIFWFLLFFQTDLIGHSLTTQYSVWTTTSRSSREIERGTWEPDCLFTQWASSQTGVWPADLTPLQTHRVKQPRRIKLSWVRFEFLSATFFHCQELFEKLKKRSSILVLAR